MIKHQIETIETKMKGNGIPRIHKGHWLILSGVEAK